MRGRRATMFNILNLFGPLALRRDDEQAERGPDDQLTSNRKARWGPHNRTVSKRSVTTILPQVKNTLLMRPAKGGGGILN